MARTAGKIAQNRSIALNEKNNSIRSFIPGRLATQASWLRVLMLNTLCLSAWSIGLFCVFYDLLL